MRSTRRGRHAGQEFGGSGEDSFVAVVVTKLTGALLFILLLTMTIMVLIPRADENRPRPSEEDVERVPLTLTTPDDLPEAITGRSYRVALSAQGGAGPLRWSLSGELPEGLVLDSGLGQIHGVPVRGPGEPVELTIAVTDGEQRDKKPVRLSILEPSKVLGWIDPARIRPVPAWRTWLDHGFGFLFLGLTGLIGLNLVGSVERWSIAQGSGSENGVRKRFRIYRGLVILVAIALSGALAFWLFRPLI